MKNHSSDNTPINHRVDAIFSDHGELSDRVWLWWEKNKALTAGCIAAIILGIAVFQLVHYWKQARLAKMQAAFLQAYESGDFSLFAANHAGHSLSGISLLLEGDVFWKNGELEQACSVYARAAKELSGTLLSYRAQLAEAMGLVKLGKTQEGTALLETLCVNLAAPAPFRAQAAYELAQMDYDRGNFVACKGHLEVIFSLEAPLWVSKARMLETFIPEGQ